MEINLFDLGKETCASLITTEDIFIIELMVFIGYLCVALSFIYDMKMLNPVRHILFTIWTVEVVGRYLDYMNFLNTIDVLTVYLCVWQLVSLVWKWMWHQIQSPILYVEQGFLCVFMSFLSFFMHNSALRYIPRKINLAFFWIVAVVDMLVYCHNSFSNDCIRFFLWKKQFYFHYRIR